MAASLEAAVGFAKSARRTFHDVPYVLAISGDSEGLAIEVEHAEDGRRWRSRFKASFIEEITQRTGNAKKFDIFVRMLLSALAQESDSVYLDVLTARDLEMLRRHANPQGPPTTSTAGQSDKRYLILTYRAEFDKVHYPLPLPLEERSEEETLRALVARLRAELAEARGQAAGSAGLQEQPKPIAAREDERVAALQRHSQELGEALRAAQREVEALRAEVRLCRAPAPPSSSGAGDAAEAQRQREKARSLQAELKALSDRAKEKDLRQKREAEAAARDLRAEQQKVERLQQQVRRLEEERRAAASRPGASAAGRPASGERSRAASRSASAERVRPPSRPVSAVRPQAPVQTRSRQPSRASSAASSRERTPSPSTFLRNGSARRVSPAPRSAERTNAFQRSSSPGAMREGRRAPSPGATLSPYRQAAGSLEPARRAPSPGQRGGRDPSPAQYTGSLPAVGTGRTPMSLRERSGSGAPHHAASPTPDMGAARAKPASTRYGGSRPSSAARGGAAGGRSSLDGSRERESSQHRPGSLFGLAADLGMGPGSSAGSVVGAGGSGGSGASAAGAAAGPVADAADACDIDARLQALQSFLKQTKHISG